MSPYDFFAINIKTEFAICMKSTDVYDATCESAEPYTGNGALYNWFVAQGDIAPAGWKMPTITDFEILGMFLDANYNPYAPDYDASSMGGNKLKEIGLFHWMNAFGTDDYSFKGIGSGHRRDDGSFEFLKRDELFWTATFDSVDDGKTCGLNTATDVLAINYYSSKKFGKSIRFVKYNSDDPGTVKDSDGNVYNTIKIGNQVWMAANLNVKHFNDGTLIPEVTDNTSWAALTTPGMCYYNNTP